MSLSSKTLCLLFLVLAFGTGLAYGVLRWVVQPGFVSAERLDARTDVSRCVDAIEREFAHLGHEADVVARSSAAREALAAHDFAPLVSRFPTERFTSGGLSYAALVGADGKVLWHDARDETSGVPIDFREFPCDQFPAGEGLLRRTADGSGAHAALCTSAGPMLVVAKPVSQQSDAPLGTVVMARLLSTDLRDELSSLAHVDFRLVPLSEELADDGQRSALTKLESGDDVVLREGDGETLVGYAVLRDVERRPAVLVVADIPRRITPMAAALLRACFAFFVAIAAMLLVVMHRRMRRAVLEPIAALSCAVRDYARGGNFRGGGGRVPEDGEGELGALGSDVNTMLARLEEAHAQLRAAKEAAESASIAKTQFVANISHEIRTPMNGIVGMAQHLLSMPLAGEVRECVEMVRRSSDVMLGLLNDVLDYSKIDSGNLVLERIEFDPRDVVEGVGEILAWNAHRRGIALVTDVRPGVPRRLFGDPVRLRQALLNFASNAVKFTEKGEVVIAVDVDAETPAHTMLRFSVKDTGIGIAPEHRERLFRAFSQVDASTTRRFGGTGLGLAIARELAARMQGVVGLESALGAGSLFWFTARIERPSESAETPVPEPLRELRVLVVDGSHATRRAIANMMLPWPAQLAECEGADAAVAALSDAENAGAPVQLVLVDDGIDGGGEALVRRIRATPRIAATPLVRLVRLGTNASPSSASGLSLTADKPLRAAQLVERALAALASLAQEKGPAASAPANAPTGLDILLAEDNPANQQVVDLVLRRHGHRVRIVSNGREAVAACAESRHDLVLMDSHMPIMDGLEATRLIRAAEAPDGRTPIIALTAVAQEGAREMFLRAGFDDYVAKPFNVAELLATIERWRRRAEMPSV